MCGLFGMAGNGITKVDLLILDDLMLVSSTRGTDGTGLVSGRSFVSEGPRRAQGYKLPGDPFYWRYMVEEKKNSDIYNVTNTWFVGHTRARSVGFVNTQSCQPFVLSKIVGTHNGTINGDYEPFNTDSEKLVNRINLVGEEGLEDLLSSLPENSSYALVWYNFKEKRLHFLRNSRRSLYFAMNKKRAVMYWASEKRFLDFALEREEYDCYYFAEDYHYALKISSIKHNGAYSFSKTEAKPRVNEKESKIISIGESENDLLDLPWIRDNLNQQQNKRIN